MHGGSGTTCHSTFRFSAAKLGKRVHLMDDEDRAILLRLQILG
jgi:hypothetical protein